MTKVGLGMPGVRKEPEPLPVLAPQPTNRQIMVGSVPVGGDSPV